MSRILGKTLTTTLRKQAQLLFKMDCLGISSAYCTLYLAAQHLRLKILDKSQEDHSRHAGVSQNQGLGGYNCGLPDAQSAVSLKIHLKNYQLLSQTLTVNGGNR